MGQPNLIDRMHQKSRGSEVEKEILSRGKEREEEGKGKRWMDEEDGPTDERQRKDSSDLLLPSFDGPDTFLFLIL